MHCIICIATYNLYRNRLKNKYYTEIDWNNYKIF